MSVSKFILCESRHPMPTDVTESIFPNRVDPTDLKEIEATVSAKLCNCEAVDLYVTGLTVCVAEVIRYCMQEFIPLTLYHYNSANGEFYPQVVSDERYCSVMRYNLKYNFD